MTYLSLFAVVELDCSYSSSFSELICIVSSTHFFFIASILFFFLINLFILFLPVLGLHFCARAFSSYGEWGPLFIAVRGPLTIAVSLVAEHKLQMRRLSSCGSRA